MSRALFVAALVALFTVSSNAQCTGFLILKDQKIFSDQDGKEEIQKIRKDALIGIPDRPSAWYMGALVQINNDLGVCFLNKAKVNEKNGLMKLLIIDKFGAGSGWLNPKEAIEVKYEIPGGTNALILPGRPQENGAENYAALKKAALLELDRVTNASFKPPEIDNQKEFPTSFEDTWAGLIETLSDGKWQIESIDKNSGLITTKPAVDHGGATMICATAFDKDHKTWLNVFVKKTEKGARVKVNATFHAIREDEIINCYSNGNIEKEIFSGISKSLDGEKK